MWHSSVGDRETYSSYMRANLNHSEDRDGLIVFSITEGYITRKENKYFCFTQNVFKQKLSSHSTVYTASWTESEQSFDSNFS